MREPSLENIRTATVAANRALSKTKKRIVQAKNRKALTASVEAEPAETVYKGRVIKVQKDELADEHRALSEYDRLFDDSDS